MLASMERDGYKYVVQARELEGLIKKLKEKEKDHNSVCIVFFF